MKKKNLTSGTDLSQQFVIRPKLTVNFTAKFNFFVSFALSPAEEEDKRQIVPRPNAACLTQFLLIGGIKL